MAPGKVEKRGRKKAVKATNRGLSWTALDDAAKHQAVGALQAGAEFKSVAKLINRSERQVRRIWAE